MGCEHNCDKCGGCGIRDLTLTEEEIRVLRTFAVLPFQPVARRTSEEVPFCRELEEFPREMLSNILLLLEKKGLIEIDYKIPLGSFSYAGYEGYPVRGSMALTARGQSVLDLLEVQGAQ